MSATRTADAPGATRARRPWREAVAEIVALIDANVPMEPAAESVGVAISTLRDHLDDPEAEPIQLARARFEARIAAALAAHAVEGRPHGAAAYLLERLAPKRWKQPQTIAGDDSADPIRSTVTITLAEATAAARERDEEDR